MSDWTAFPGPKYYRPEAVEPALAEIGAVSSELAASDAYNKVLFAIGNNHGGTLYPAAVAAAPRILELALRGEDWTRYAAFEVLVELCVFDAEVGFEQFTGAAGERIDTKHAVMSVLRSARRSLLSVLADDTEVETVRIDVLDIVEQLNDSVDDVVAVLRGLPERTAQGTFDGRRRAFLVEHGYPEAP